MRKLLTADFRRIMRKKSIWIVVILTLIATVIGTMDGIDGAPDRGFQFTSSVMSVTGTMELLFGLVILLSVYGDEFRSMTLISVIGRGISREKFILAKFLDALFLLGQLFVLYSLFVVLMRHALGVTLTTLETRAIVMTILSSLYNAVAVVTIAALFLYLTGSSSFGVFIYMTLSVILPVVITFANLLPQVKRFHLDRWYVYGFGSRATASILHGASAAGILTLLLGVLLYIVSTLVLTWLVFRRKELDF